MHCSEWRMPSSQRAGRMNDEAPAGISDGRKVPRYFTLLPGRSTEKKRLLPADFQRAAESITVNPDKIYSLGQFF